MSFESKDEQTLLANFNMLCSLLSPERTDQTQRPKADLSRLEEIIHRKIPDALSKNAPPDYYDLYTDFQAEHEKLRDYILYDRLIGKSVVALGGGFSSGKSTFLNTLIQYDVLPTALKATTAVPTYLVHTDGAPTVEAINIFDVKMEFNPVFFDSISHDFGKIQGEDGQELSKGTPLSHVLESAFAALPMEEFQNIAFLDTPGYSKSDSDNYSARTDEQIARRQLSTANFILWCVDAREGVIGKNDIEFLKSVLRPDLSFAVILTRADERESSIEEIRKKVQRVLNDNGLGKYCRGVFAYARDEEDGFDMPGIRALLAEWNQSAPEPDFSINFKRLFIRCRDYCAKEISKTERQLIHLNTAVMSSDLGEEAEKSLGELRSEIEGQQKSLKEVRASVETLQKEFFQELKNVGDQVNIRMPEPNDEVLWKENSGDALGLLRQYNEKKGVKPNPKVANILRDALGGIELRFRQFGGGSEHQKKLLDIMRENCRVAPEEVRFNEIYQRLDAYQKLVRALAPQSDTE